MNVIELIVLARALDVSAVALVAETVTDPDHRP